MYYLLWKIFIIIYTYNIYIATIICEEKNWLLLKIQTSAFYHYESQILQ